MPLTPFWAVKLLLVSCLSTTVYRNMLSQFGEVVMFVPSSRLHPIPRGKYPDSLRIRASRDPLGRSGEAVTTG